MIKYSISFILLFLLIDAPLNAQRRGQVDYISLANRAASSNFFFEELILPPSKTTNPELVFIFKMDNSFLPFKKKSIEDNILGSAENEFYSIARLNTEIFKGKVSKNDLENISSFSRDVWQDTLFAETYKDTKSKSLFTSGILVTSLTPGMYNYVLQLSLMEETDDRNSQRRNVMVPDFKTKKTGEVYLLNNNSTFEKMEFLNIGDNVLYGKDFKALIRVPNYDAFANYQVEINKVNITRRDTSKIETITEIDLKNESFKTNSTIELIKSTNPSIQIKNNGDFVYALVDIPNAAFENSVYSLSLKKKGGTEILARKIFRSYWPDIPPSLLNLDVSIEMMKFIVSEKEIDRLKKGSQKEKEAKFREFWKKRDPTPDTEYNELMTEYYNRIHYAFVEFRSPESPYGQETDRGEVYIKYGPPISRDRTFPKKGLVIETWNYGNRTFVFEKGTGFSEFKLLGKE